MFRFSVIRLMKAEIRFINELFRIVNGVLRLYHPTGRMLYFRELEFDCFLNELRSLVGLNFRF